MSRDPSALDSGGSPLTIGSLFSGIGGLELGLERAGLGPVVWQVEQDAYCRAVLAKHWPDATRFEDVRDVGGRNLTPVDVICGGFPCQDISVAGRGAGLDGQRSILWFEFQRIVAEIQPQWIVAENVAAIEGKKHRAFQRAVLSGLRSLGYRGERAILSASDVGASQRRDRWFLVAHSERARLPRPLANATLPEREEAPYAQLRDRTSRPWLALDGDRGCLRSPDGFSVAMDRHRIRALGNAVVPQVAEVVGRKILEIEARERVA